MFYTSVCRNKNSLYHKYIDDDGVRHHGSEKYCPVLYKKIGDHLSIQEDTPHRSLKGAKLKRFQFDDLISYYKEVRKYEETQYGVYGVISPIYQFIAERYPEESINFDVDKLRILYVDIEVEYTTHFPDPETAKNPITTIAIHDSLTKETVVLGTKPSTAKDYVEFEDEKEMLIGFLDIWEGNLYPDIVVTWNGEKFDIPYIYGRLSKYKLATRLSPIHSIKKIKKIDEYYKEYTKIDIQGVQLLDLMMFYKKFITAPRKSYSLDAIGEHDVGINKVDYSDYRNLGNLYEQNYDLYVEYNRHDVNLMIAINNKIKLIELVVTLAYLAKINYTDTISPVKTWDAMAYNYLLREGIIVEPKILREKESYPGAFVMEPIPGLYKWVMSIDVVSMYPKIIQMLNIGPETLRVKFDPATCSKSPSEIIMEIEKIKTKVGERQNISKKMY